MKAPTRLYRTRWDKPDREWLEHQHFILGKPYKQIAEEIGSGADTIQDWACMLGVDVEHLFPAGSVHPPVKVGDGYRARFYGWSKKWLEQQYVERDLSAKQIADEIGSAHVAVIKWLKKFGFQLRDRDEMNKRHSKRMSGQGNPAWVNGSSGVYQKKLRHQRSNVCEWCGTSKKLQVHHLDHDRANNNPENIMVLCGTCNRLEACLWALQNNKCAIVSMVENTITICFTKHNGGKIT